jgi:Uma2 family endonuclease
MPYMTGQNEIRPTSATKLTYQDFLGFPDDGLRHELIDGEHVVTPSPTPGHQKVSVELVVALDGYLKWSGLGELYHAPLDVVLSETDVVEPDLLVVLSDQADIVTAQQVRGAPALVVEILSPGTRRRDMTKKRRLYERSGVREYWIVDPDNQRVTVCRSTPASPLETVEELSAVREDTLTSPMLPGFSVAVGGLFAGRVGQRPK